jgi:flavin reductase (DIM6/NTAB) family NADH-FMN oxidoreductase RutF
MPKVLAVIQVIEKRRAECHERPQEAEGPLVYSLRTSFVLPRPIAWVTSVGQTGVVNAAPFSFFNVFCEDPPLCMFAVNQRPDGRVKDTLVNIRRTAEFVVNLTDDPLARAMHESSGDFPSDLSRSGASFSQSRKETATGRRFLLDWSTRAQ